MNKRLIILALLALASCTTGMKTGLVCNHPQWTKGHGVQGMDIYQNILVQGHNRGVISVYEFNGRELKPLGGFPLESYHKNNHCNVISMGADFAAPADPLPLIYVSQCSKKNVEEYKDVCYVERILPGFGGAKKVQTIAYDDVNSDFGYALQWVVDAPNRMLYGYGNTTGDRDVENNRHRIIKFALPQLDTNWVVLKPEDALENYLIEDYGFSFATIGQGLYIKDGRLYMPTGFGTEEFPSHLFVWNLETKQMEKDIDLMPIITGEPEDLGMYNGRFILTGIDGIFVLPDFTRGEWDKTNGLSFKLAE